MAFALKLPPPWESRGWKAKIRDRERVEPPHVTILHKAKAWRFSLRTERFLDTEPNPSEVPNEVLEEVRLDLPLLRKIWDRMYPENPIISEPTDKPKAKRKPK